MAESSATHLVDAEAGLGRGETTSSHNNFQLPGSDVAARNHDSSTVHSSNSEIELSLFEGRYRAHSPSRDTGGVPDEPQPGQPTPEQHTLRFGAEQETASRTEQLGLTAKELGPPVKSRHWIPGVKNNFPWSFFMVVIGTIAWFGACVGVIFSADKTKTHSWSVPPAVILAILGPIGSIMLQYALACGLVITWWTSALSGTTLGTLHRQWDHGTSILAAATAGRHADRLALAKVMVLSTFAVNPLLQRALTTTIRTDREDVKLSTVAATDVQSLRDMNFTDAYQDAFQNPVQLAPSMAQIVQQFTDRRPITSGITGCAGNCSGTLTAAGIDAQCTTVRNSSFTADFGGGAGGATLVFRADTNVMNYQTHSEFNLSTFFAETHVVDDNDDESEYDQLRSCRGVSTAVTCALRHAVVAYPFTQTDGVITPATRRSQLRVLSTEPVGEVSAEPSRYEPVFGGLSIAATSLINSTATVETMSKYGWGARTSGPLTAAYLSRGGDARTCAVAFDDPTEDVLSKLNEIMFRVALAAPNASSTAAEFVAQQQMAVIVYESRYVYLWCALAITAVAVMSVVPTVVGFQDIGREVTLSPVEIARAFGAQLLSERGTSNMAVGELMGLCQDVRVQYQSIECPGTEGLTDDGRPVTKLQLAVSGQGRKPHPGELFAG